MMKAVGNLLLALLIPSVGVAQATARITVGKNVHVSHALPTGIHDEVIIGTDPANASRIVACSIFQPDYGLWDLRTVVYASIDGGKSWSPPLLIDSAGIDAATLRPANSADPGCVYGVNGAMHFIRLPLQAYWSTDGGKTWTVSKVPKLESNDRTNVVVDHSGGKYHGRVYLWAQMGGSALDVGYVSMGLTLWRSLDGGKTFERPVQRFSTEKEHFQPGISIVLSDGTFAAVTRTMVLGKDASDPKAPTTSRIKVITSTDGGESLNEAVTVAGPFQSKRRAAIPMIAADTHSVAFRDRIYVIWADQETRGRYQVMLAYSSDRGKTWSSPRVVSDALPYATEDEMAENIDRIAIAVNPAGVVGVAWEDSRDATNRLAHGLRFAASLDGGDTFSPSVKVSEALYDPGAQNIRTQVWADAPRWESNTAFTVNRSMSGGHTIAMAADIAGGFHPLWTDNRTGVNQVWTSTVKVEGTPVKFGSDALATLQDLSDKTKIEILGSTYDQAKQRLTIRARLRNQSAETLVGPIKVRALVLSSEATTNGTAVAVETENQIGGIGAVWDFTPLMQGGSLPPNSVTRERTLVFELRGLRPIGPGKTFSHGWPLPSGLLHFEGQVIGSSRPATSRQ